MRESKYLLDNEKPVADMLTHLYRVIADSQATKENNLIIMDTKMSFSFTDLSKEKEFQR